MEKIQSIWGKYEGSNDNTFHVQGGFVGIKLMRYATGWMIRDEYMESVADHFMSEMLKESNVLLDSHIYQTGTSKVLYVKPSLPVKPIVFRNNTELWISPKQSLRIFLAIPINIQFYTRRVDDENLFYEASTYRLSDTWFGEPDSGEPAFSIGARFGTHPKQLEARYFEAICPVQIHNNSSQMLELQRLIVQVDYLKLYQKDNHLITDLVSVEYKGPDQVSNLQFSTEKQFHGDSPVILNRPRKDTGKNILGKSFHFIKNLSQ